MFKILVVLLGIVFITGATGVALPPQQKTGNVQAEDKISIAVLQGETDGYPFFVSINSSLKDYPGKAELPWFVSVSTAFIDPTKNGLPKEKEFAGLNDWEDLVEARISKACRYAYLGHVTAKGSRQVLFYIDDRSAAENALKRLQEEGKTLVFEFKVKRDDNWENVDRYFKAKPKSPIN